MTNTTNILRAIFEIRVLKQSIFTLFVSFRKTLVQLSQYSFTFQDFLDVYNLGNYKEIPCSFMVPKG